MADHIKSSLQVGIDYIVKLLLSHPHQKHILRNTCIIDKHIHTAKLLLDRFDHVSRKCKITDITLYRLADHTKRLDLLHGLLIQMTVIIQYDITSLFGKCQSDRLADALGCSCHNDVFFF